MFDSIDAEVSRTDKENPPRVTVNLLYCYSRVTPESADQGDQSEFGFYEPGGWYWPCPSREIDEWCSRPSEYVSVREVQNVARWASLMKNSCDPGNVSAREALESVLSNLGACECVFQDNNSLILEEINPREDYRTGETTRHIAYIRGNPRLLHAILREVKKRG